MGPRTTREWRESRLPIATSSAGWAYLAGLPTAAREEALQKLVGTYYKTSMENAKIAKGKQPAVVDARSQTQFILDRTDSVVEMGYITKKPGRDAIDWTMLEEVIKENPDLYSKLKYKSAA